jgi:hypothetical protein
MILLAFWDSHSPSLQRFKIQGLTPPLSWRYEAVDVGFVAAKGIDSSIEYQDCEAKYVDDGEAIVACHRAHLCLVHLKKMVRPNGIWTATSVEIVNKPDTR